MISVGIDVSKGKSTVCILKPGGEVLKAPFEIMHTMESLHTLVNLIKAYDEEVRVVLEDAGHYHLPVVAMLLDNDVFVHTVNAPYQSGNFNATERHISKRGNKYLRKTGYEIMQSLIMHKPTNSSVYDFIEKKRSEGKCSKEAMIAGLNKFLRVY